MAEEETRGMILFLIVILLSAVMFFYYFHVTCQKILRRQFDREYVQSIVNANPLEFPPLLKSLEEFGAPVDHPRLRGMLKSDFLALTDLLKNEVNVNQCYSRQERLLILYLRLYLRWQFLSLPVRRLLKAGEKEAILRLIPVLQYFAYLVDRHTHRRPR
jgi:hypothetical protein